MKNVAKIGAQGDVLFVRVDSVPSNAVKDEKSDNKVIVAHSETGHHHVAEAVTDMVHFTMPKGHADEGLVGYLKVKGDVKVKHLRDHDTHTTLNLLSDGGGEVIWEYRRGKEYTPEGWKRIED